MRALSIFRKRNLADIDKELTASRAKTDALEAERKKFIDEWLCEHPLSDNEKTALLFTFDAKEPLCCERGKTNLRELGFSEPWVDYINNWAYDHLGCQIHKPVDYRVRLKAFLRDPIKGE